jgi:ATP-dependent helicase/nuclease subunit B
LPLEAAMAAAGAFPGVPDARVVGLEYWRLTGRRESGAVFAAGGRKADVAELVADSACGLRRLIAAFDDPAQPYLAQPIPGIRPRFSDYAQLARVGEFSAGTDEE